MKSTDESVGQADGRRFLPTDNQLKAWEEQWHGEKREETVQRYQLLKTLDEAGRLQLPPDVDSVEDFMSRERSIGRAEVLDNTGRPLVVDGSHVTF